jgi:hypothetical protein
MGGLLGVKNATRSHEKAPRIDPRRLAATWVACAASNRSEGESRDR